MFEKGRRETSCRSGSQLSPQHRKCPAPERISPSLDQRGAAEAAPNAERGFGVCVTSAEAKRCQPRLCHLCLPDKRNTMGKHNRKRGERDPILSRDWFQLCLVGDYLPLKGKQLRGKDKQGSAPPQEGRGRGRGHPEPPPQEAVLYLEPW